MRILFTGAAGFIGYHTAERLIGLGHEVVGFDNLNPYYDVTLKQARLKALARHEGFRFVKADLGDRTAVEAMFAFSTTSTNGLTAALNSISLGASSTLYGLGASAKRYNELASAVAKAQDTIATQSEAMTNRLTQQFASQNAKSSEEPTP